MATDLNMTPEITRALDEYLRQVDLSLPGTIEGFYLVGSIALDDYVPSISDIDFVAVSANPLSEQEIQALVAVHQRLAETPRIPKFDGIYTTWAALSVSTRNVTVHHWLDSIMHRDSQYGANPVTWATLRKQPVVIRGTHNPVVFHSDQELREWCKANLRGYWASWISSSRGLGKKLLASFTLEAICWGVLGVLRLHATIRTGEIISKTQAFYYGQQVFPSEWNAVLGIAFSGRRAEIKKPMIRLLERRSMALRFMEYAIADATRTADRMR